MFRFLCYVNCLRFASPAEADGRQGRLEAGRLRSVRAWMAVSCCQYLFIGLLSGLFVYFNDIVSSEQSSETRCIGLLCGPFTNIIMH